MFRASIANWVTWAIALVCTAAVGAAMWTSSQAAQAAMQKELAANKAASDADADRLERKIDEMNRIVTGVAEDVAELRGEFRAMRTRTP